MTTAAQTYDTYLLAKAHEFYELKDLTAMKAWMDANNVVIPGADVTTVYGYFLGRVQQVAIELARWVERIPEAHRG
jgi:hypothetical protein